MMNKVDDLRAKIIQIFRLRDVQIGIAQSQEELQRSLLFLKKLAKALEVNEQFSRVCERKTIDYGEDYEFSSTRLILPFNFDVRKVVDNYASAEALQP